MAKSSKKSFLDYFKVNYSGDEFEDDLFDEDDDDEDDDFDTKPSHTSSRTAYSATSTSQGGQATQKKQKPVKQTKGGNTYSNGSNKLVSINNNRSQYGSNQVHVIKPDEFDDAQMIIDHLKSGQAIVINMEGMEVSTAQRIIDFIAGACYALDGSLQGISGNIFIAAPSEIYVSGDLRDELLSDASLSPQLGRF